MKGFDQMLKEADFTWFCAQQEAARSRKGGGLKPLCHCRSGGRRKRKTDQPEFGTGRHKRVVLKFLANWPERLLSGIILEALFRPEADGSVFIPKADDCPAGARILWVLLIPGRVDFLAAQGKESDNPVHVYQLISGTGGSV
jgi:hypothetical protein